jgi:hypothetical protein
VEKKIDSLLSRVKEYVEGFNREDNEIYKNAVPNSGAYEWMAAHIPLIDIPDKELETVYYFRWWTYRKHIKKVPAGYIISEFLPDVPWAGRYNSISCAAGHHLKEGRWLRDEPAFDAYINYWYNDSDNINSYSNWIDYMVCEIGAQRNDYSLGLKNLDRMIRYYTERERTNFRPDYGLFWSPCDRDGQEFSISGNGFRLPLNCYMAGNARSISCLASLAGRSTDEEKFDKKRKALEAAIEKYLWSEKDRFYLNIHVPEKDGKADIAREDNRFRVKELWGYTPWYFRLAPKGREDAFSAMTNPDVFSGAYGLTTAARAHECYGIYYTGEELNTWLARRGEKPAGPKGHECLWNGPSWPFATSIALSGLAASERDEDGLFYKLLSRYAGSHHLHPNNSGKGQGPYWIDEVQHPDTGDWISRTRLEKWSDCGGWDDEKGGLERGKDYNHSTFCDLVISGLFGIQISEWGSPAAAPLAKPRFPRDWQNASLYRLPFGGKLYALEYSGGKFSITLL